MLAQDATALATAILVLVCLLASALVRGELRGEPERPYLMAFFLFALTFFLAHYNPSKFDGYYFQLFRNVVGASFAFTLPAALCKRERAVIHFRLLVILFVIDLSLILFGSNPTYSNYVFAGLAIGVGLLVMIRKQNLNIAETGLIIVLTAMFLLLVVELFVLPIDIDKDKHYRFGFIWVLISLPAYICAVTVCLLLSYKIEVNDKLKELASLDALTGIANRRSGFSQIEKHVSMLRRNHNSAAVIMADIDHFKQVNDTYGHLFGDKVIATFADIIKQELRDYDVCCRYGGEEFLLFLPNVQIDTAMGVAERIRSKLMVTAIKFGDKETSVTASFGVALWQLQQVMEINIERADKALYQAKEGGRNCVRVD
ncbi:GGDEF domain-containing protein [Thalassotalea euphylliae]|uniref:GGDEF domain-containing protein n=1 Tax=Thalassotalea euphylliae TaxID=1655234 RepID=UPI00363F7218